eukprot:scpid75511/ scgid30495/ Cytochrome b561; Cytochrome b-561
MMRESGRKRRARDRVSEADPPTVSCCMFILFEALCFTPSVMLLGWAMYYAGGFAWDGSHKQFNWHPFCMCLAMATFFSNSIVAYRIFPFHRRTRKFIHALMHLMTLFVALIGLTAVFLNHQRQSIPHLYSLHSWCGLAVICLAGMQWLCGLLTFVFPLFSAGKRADFKPWHVRIGHLIFFGAIATCLIGINEKMSFLGNHTHTHSDGETILSDLTAKHHKPAMRYSDLPNEAVLCNVIGMILVLLAGVVFSISSQPDYTSGEKMRGFQLVSSG